MLLLIEEGPEIYGDEIDFLVDDHMVQLPVPPDQVHVVLHLLPPHDLLLEQKGELFFARPQELVAEGMQKDQPSRVLLVEVDGIAMIL